MLSLQSESKTMATSQKQLEANRLNAQKSTGPRSTEGRNKTRLNALRDGFTGQVTTLSDEDRPIFEQFKKDLITDLAPKTTMELSLAHAVAWDTWRLNRLRAVESNMYALGAEAPGTSAESDDPEIQAAFSTALVFSNEAQKFALMSIYEQRMNRSLHKNLATLRDLQAERKKNYKHDQAQEVAIARYSDLKGLTYQAPKSPTLNGSVFSNNEILAAANRLTTLQVAKGVIYRDGDKVQFAGAGQNVSTWPKPEAA